MAQAKSDAQLAEEVDVRSSRVAAMAFRHEPGTHAVRCVGLLRYQHDCAGRIAWHESSDDSFATESADRPVAVFRCLRGDLRLLHACGGGVPPGMCSPTDTSSTCCYSRVASLPGWRFAR